MTGIGIDLEELARSAGLEPDSAQYKLASELAQADDQLLEDLVTMRHAKGLTQQDVADRIGRNKSVVSNFERLSADPHLSTIRRYAAAIGATIRHEVHDFDSLNATDYRGVSETSFDIVLNDVVANTQEHLWTSLRQVHTIWANVTPHSNVVDIEPARRRMRRREAIGLTACIDA